MAKVVGIDLGTTNSCVAFMDNDRAVVIPNAEGSRTTPSIVGFSAQNDRMVGQLAKRQVLTNPEHTVMAVKRLIGRKLNDPEIQKHLSVCPNELFQAPNGDIALKLRGRDYSPPEISAMVLSAMKEVAEAYLGEKISEAVITVPAYFDEAQRQATKDAGKIAGLEVLRIINEPTAAALAYGQDQKVHEKIAVYDLGGGTFDISVLEVRDGVFEVKATNGDTYLGGEDFDRRIMDFLADGFLTEHNIDLRKEKMALQRLKEAAERAKHELSSSLETEVNLPFIAATGAGPLHLVRAITRSEYEGLVDDLIQSTLGPCEVALRDAGLKPSEIDQIILVGGQTRMPRIQEVVEQFFQKKPNKKVDPDEVVAVGAAIQAGVLKGVVQEVLLLDVTPLSLGVQTAGGIMTKIIPKNTTVPTRKQQIFSTAVDNQPFVEVHVLQGERDMAEDCKSLAKFQLMGIPPAPRGVPQIQVTFDIDANGLVHVSAKDLGTNKEQAVKVVPTSGLNEEEIQRIIGEAETQKESDRKKRELADRKLELESLVYTSSRAVAEYGHLLPQTDRESIKVELDAAQGVMDGGSLEEIEQLKLRLEDLSHRIGEAVYAQTTQGVEEEESSEEPV